MFFACTSLSYRHLPFTSFSSAPTTSLGLALGAFLLVKFRISPVTAERVAFQSCIPVASRICLHTGSLFSPGSVFSRVSNRPSLVLRKQIQVKPGRLLLVCALAVFPMLALCCGLVWFEIGLVISPGVLVSFATGLAMCLFAFQLGNIPVRLQTCLASDAQATFRYRQSYKGLKSSLWSCSRMSSRSPAAFQSSLTFLHSRLTRYKTEHAC